MPTFITQVQAYAAWRDGEVFWPEKSSWEMRAPEAMTRRKLNNEELNNSTEGKDLITKWCGDRDEGGVQGTGIKNPSSVLEARTDGKALHQGG